MVVRFFLSGIFLLIFCEINIVFSQTREITGTVFDAESNLPIKGIRVAIKDTAITTNTDEKGFFKLEIPDKLNIVAFADFQGMKVKEINIINTNNYHIYLSNSSSIIDIPLDELLKIKIVTAGKKAEEISQIPSSVTVLTRKEIENFGYNSLREIINSITGYYVMSNLGIDIYGVRGFCKEKGNNFVIMVNGEKITDQRILKFYQIPVEAIDKIEIVKGPMAVMYGNNAFFGAINIITNSETTNMVTVSTGTLNTRQITGRTFINRSGIKISVNFALSATDGPEFSLAEMITRPERLNEPLFGGAEGKGLALPEYAKTTKKYLDKNQQYIDFTTSYNGFYFNGFIMESNNGWYYYYPSLNNGCRFKNENITLMSGYRYEISSNLAFDTKLLYSKTYSYNEYHHLFETFYGWETFSTKSMEAELNLFWTPFPKLNITTGLQYENMLEYVNEQDVPIANLTNMITNFVSKNDNGIVYSSFFQLDYNPVKKLKIVLGARIEQRLPYSVDQHKFQGVTNPPAGIITDMTDTIAKSKTDFIPRIAFIYSLNPHNCFKLLYGKAIKRPGYEIFADDMSDIKAGEKTTGYSKPEYITTYELNYLSTINKKLSFNISLFKNNLENLLVEKSEIVNKILRAWWWNAGKMETNGIEASVQLGDKNKFFGEITGVYQETTDNTVAKTSASFSPNFLGYLKMSYILKKQYTFSLTGNYVGKMHPFYNYSPVYDEQKQPTGQYIGRTSLTVDPYFLLNANIKLVPLFLKGGYININCSNILNTQFYYPAFSINNAWADKGTLGLTRMFYLTVGYKF